jgi:UDP-GlcNAc:undecaprenyl-phosphate GlcNAc-1-phosphate transferase
MSAFFSSFIFPSLLASLLLALVCSGVSIPLARRLGLMDVPGSAPHKRHNHPTPIGGGLAMAVVLLILPLVYPILSNADILAVFASSMIVLILALWDDYRGIPPLAKLAGQILSVVVLIRLGVYVRIFESPEFFINGQGGIYVWLDWLLTAFWVIGITNAVNFVDSMDGLAAALAGTAAAFFMLVTLDSNQPLLSRVNALLVGTCIGLYFFNAPPARMFLGDGGAQTLGFWLACLAIVYTPKGAFQTSSWFVPILILGVPIFDTVLVTFSRLRRGRPFYRSSLDHTYHRLVALGMEPNRAVVAMHLVSLALGCLAFVALGLPPLAANLIFVTVLLLGLAAVFILDRKKHWA